MIFQNILLMAVIGWIWFFNANFDYFVWYAALSCPLLGHRSTTSQRSTAKMNDSKVSRRCVTVNRSSATMLLSCVNVRRKSHALTERRYIVLYRLNFVRSVELIFCWFVAVRILRGHVWFVQGCSQKFVWGWFSLPFFLALPLLFYLPQNGHIKINDVLSVLNKMWTLKQISFFEFRVIFLKKLLQVCFNSTPTTCLSYDSELSFLN